MSTVVYQLRLKDTDGALQAIFDQFSTLTYTKILNGVGTLTFLMDGEDTRKSLFTVDSRVEVWRRDPLAFSWYLDYEGFVRSVRRYINEEGMKLFEVTCLHPNSLLSRRVILPTAGSEFNSQSGPADTVLTNIVLANAGSMAASQRQIPEFTVTTATGSATNYTSEFRYENLYDSCIDIITSIREAGSSTACDFSVESSGIAGFNFRTYYPYYGNDKTTGTASAVVFSLERSNMNVPGYLDNHAEEVTSIFVLGSGEGANRNVYNIVSESASSVSVYNRIESQVDAQEAEDAAAITAVSNLALQENRRIRQLSFVPVETESTRYGLHWVLGDLVTARFDDQEFTCRAEAISVEVTESEGETLNAVMTSV